MHNKKLFIIGGCNGAGKTTASFNILPDILDCKEFVNADEIARGLSPFQPEKASIEAGKIMLNRIHELLKNNEDFAIETTLSSKGLKRIIDSSKKLGYSVSLIYFWLESTELAKKRVQIRTDQGGHSIPYETIVRRYYKGLNNLFRNINHLCDLILIYDNSGIHPELIYEKALDDNETIYNSKKWNSIKSMAR